VAVVLAHQEELEALAVVVMQIQPQQVLLTLVVAVAHTMVLRLVVLEQEAQESSS
jgi:hypothetical protein